MNAIISKKIVVATSTIITNLLNSINQIDADLLNIKYRLGIFSFFKTVLVVMVLYTNYLKISKMVVKAL